MKKINKHMKYKRYYCFRTWESNQGEQDMDKAT